MEILLERYGNGDDSTGGLLSVNGEHFCYTCEDEGREVKVQDETRIPPGRYEIKLRDAGGMNKRYKAKYKFHRGMLHLQNVPGFEWIYIHVGNTDDHTSGCILVGYSATISVREYTVGSSVAAYSDLYKLISEAIEKGERIHIEVV